MLAGSDAADIYKRSVELKSKNNVTRLWEV